MLSGKQIRQRIELTNNLVILTVENEVNGIDAEYSDRVFIKKFERFRARTRFRPQHRDDINRIVKNGGRLF